MTHDWQNLAGQLLFVGFEGQIAPLALCQRIARGEVGGVILFSRNMAHPQQVAELLHTLARCAPADQPLLLGVDQEGGRVQRLRHPLAEWPPMRHLAAMQDLELTHQVGRALGTDLHLLGFNLDFAPVLDVVSSDENTVIGDRSFGSTVEVVITHGLALARGLKEGGVLPCAKHFPGHGGPVADSHHLLPTDPRTAEEITNLDLQPFVAAIDAGLPLLMTAHVKYPAFDPTSPATVSRTICTALLREHLGFDGLLISDDLEMGAIAQHFAVDAAVVSALRAGVDMMLLCRNEAKQQAALEALVQAARSSSHDRSRLEESAHRVQQLKAHCVPLVQLSPAHVLERIQASTHDRLLRQITNHRSSGG